MRMRTRTENPMKVDLIVAKICDSCDFSTLKNARLLNHQWRNGGAKALLSKSFVRLPFQVSKENKNQRLEKELKNAFWSLIFPEGQENLKKPSGLWKKFRKIPNIKIRHVEDIEVFRELGIFTGNIKDSIVHLQCRKIEDDDDEEEEAFYYTAMQKLLSFDLPSLKYFNQCHSQSHDQIEVRGHYHRSSSKTAQFSSDLLWLLPNDLPVFITCRKTFLVQKLAFELIHDDLKNIDMELQWLEQFAEGNPRLESIRIGNSLSFLQRLESQHQSMRRNPSLLHRFIRALNKTLVSSSGTLKTLVLTRSLQNFPAILIPKLVNLSSLIVIVDQSEKLIFPWSLHISNAFPKLSHITLVILGNKIGRDSNARANTRENEHPIFNNFPPEIQTRFCRYSWLAEEHQEEETQQIFVYPEMSTPLMDLSVLLSQAEELDDDDDDDLHSSEISMWDKHGGSIIEVILYLTLLGFLLVVVQLPLNLAANILLV